MSKKLIITYDKSTDDVPVLLVGTEGWSGFGWQAEVNIVKCFTGDAAEEMYKKLVQKEPEFMSRCQQEPTTYDVGGAD